MGEQPYALRAEGIGKYFGRLEALKAASLWAEPGRVTTLLGRNGSGKTTLMLVAAGVLRADRGVVSFLGRASERPSLYRMARLGLMYLPQTQPLVPGFRVRDHFRAVASAFGPVGAAGAIQECRVGSLMDLRVVDLSPGERVRTSLALAFARMPRVLIADEPLVGLAPTDQEFFGHLLRRLAARGTAVVSSGHDVRVLLEISDVIIWSVAGTTHYLGTPSQALAHAQFRREYLGPAFQAE